MCYWWKLFLLEKISANVENGVANKVASRGTFALYGVAKTDLSFDQISSPGGVEKVALDDIGEKIKDNG